MIIEMEQAELEQKQKLLSQHRRNLNYLEHQAAQHGLYVPLAIHNAMAAEHEAIVNLERELAAAGISPQPKPSWQALLIDADHHWREIINNHIGQLGGTVIECQIQGCPIACPAKGGELNRPQEQQATELSRRSSIPDKAWRS